MILNRYELLKCQNGPSCLETIEVSVKMSANKIEFMSMIHLFETLCLVFFLIIIGRNEVVAKVMFLHVSVILFTGGESPGRENPPPPDRENPPPRPGRPPGPGRPPPAGRTPRTRQTPPNQADPPGPGRPPQDQAPSPGKPDFRIRSTSGRYASYWNAFLFLLQNWEKKKFNPICVVSDEKNYPSNNYTFHIALQQVSSKAIINYTM